MSVKKMIKERYGIDMQMTSDLDDYGKDIEKKEKRDTVNHPSHYNSGGIEVIDYIEDQKLGFHLGNVVKYICRHSHKGSSLQDLKKAKWYLDRLINLREE